LRDPPQGTKLLLSASCAASCAVRNISVKAGSTVLCSGRGKAAPVNNGSGWHVQCFQTLLPPHFSFANDIKMNAWQRGQRKGHDP